MKKTKILVPAIAVLALGLAATTTATVAWYEQNSVAQSYAAKVSATQFHSSTSSTQMGEFVITPVIKKQITETIVLTNNTGDTYVYAAGQTSSGQEIAATVPSGAAKHGSMQVTLSVTYKGSLTTVAEVNALWQASAAAVDVAVSDDSGYSDGKGLKFAETEFSGTNYTGASSIELEFTQANLKTANFTVAPADTDSDSSTPNETVAEITVTKTFYVAIKGVNGVVQTDSDTYAIGLTAQNH